MKFDMVAFGKHLSTLPKYSAMYEADKADVQRAGSIILSEFNRKKNAWIRTNTKHRDSGELDPTTLHSYRVNDNVFAQRKATPKGKDHSFEILLDWSGSFHGSINTAVTQAMVLSDFLRKARIPFNVQLFTQGSLSRVDFANRGEHAESGAPPILYDSARRPLILLNVLNSRMSAKQYENAKVVLRTGAIIAAGGEKSLYEYIEQAFPDMSYDVRYDVFAKVLKKWGLMGTPLNSALLVLRERMWKDATPNKIQNLIIITDGVSHNVDPTYDRNSGGVSGSNADLRCPYTGKVYSQYEKNENGVDVVRETASTQTNTILASFDWGVRKIMFFVEASNRGNFKNMRGRYATVIANRRSTSSYDIAKNVAKYRAATKENAVDIQGIRGLDHLVLMSSEMLNHHDDDDLTTLQPEKFTKKAGAKFMANNKKKQMAMALVARYLGNIIAKQYNTNVDAAANSTSGVIVENVEKFLCDFRAFTPKSTSTSGILEQLANEAWADARAELTNSTAN